MKARSLFIILLVGLSTTILSSCKKECVPKEDTIAGMIVKNVILYPKSGYLTANMGTNFHIDGSSVYASEYEISNDGGKTRQPFNFSQYNILAYPMRITCNASFEREVKIDHVTGTVLYSIRAKECGSNCDEVRIVENYVVVPAFPASYFVQYDASVETVK